MRNTVELLPHGGNECVDSVDVVCCGTVCLASDKAVSVNFVVSFARMIPSADVRLCSKQQFIASLSTLPR